MILYCTIAEKSKCYLLQLCFHKFRDWYLICRVKSEWLLDKYNSLQKVNGSPDLNNKEKEILEGFFKRVGCLAEELSPTDLESIAEAYYCE